MSCVRSWGEQVMRCLIQMTCSKGRTMTLPWKHAKWREMGGLRPKGIVHQQQQNHFFWVKFDFFLENFTVEPHDRGGGG